ncbi:MAG: hypothetical protein KAT31_04230 [Bacteroidales bacterium]|nr:hypothetical protein [Bacteroidales bacterium]
MKRFTYLFSLTLTVFALAAVVIIGCEGPAGATGAAGADGKDGIDGVDANATCTQCHSQDTDILAKSLEADGSGHMLGGHFRYGDRTDCSICHTHEGFLDIMASGAMEASKEYEDATPPNCRTCHNVHKDYDKATDFDIRFIDPVTLWDNDVVVDLGPDNNICVSCHQPRAMEPAAPAVGGADVVFTDDSWGPHHGPQSAIVWGTAAYETVGDESYPAGGSTSHANSAGCTGCHMVEPGRGDQAGGHTLSMTYESRGTAREFTASCENCHGGDADFDYMNIQTDVTALWDSLDVILHAKNILVDGDINASTAAPLTLTADEAGAVMNLLYVDEDGSTGVHNPRYVKALLKNSIQAMSN